MRPAASKEEGGVRSCAVAQLSGSFGGAHAEVDADSRQQAIG